MTEQLPDYQAILERVRAAEKQSANVKALGLVALIVALVAVVLHVPGELGLRKGKGLSTERGALEAEKIVVKDSGGKPRIVLTAERDRPALTVYDAKGTTQIAVVTVTSGTEQSMLSFFDSNGKRRIELGAAWDWPQLRFYDNNGENMARITEWAGGGAYLMLGKSEGPHVFISAATKGSTEDPEARISISDGSGDYLRGVRDVSVDLRVDGQTQDARLSISGKSGPSINMSAGVKRRVFARQGLDPPLPLGPQAYISISDSLGLGDIGKIIQSPQPPDLQEMLEKLKPRCAIDLSAMTGVGPSLRLIDTQGKTRTVLGTTDLVNTKTDQETKTAPSSLVLFDKDGKVLWKAP